jgi:hypothetical protein
VTDLDPRNNLDHWSSFKFKTEFELKFRELNGAEIFLILIEILRGFRNSSNMVQNSLVTPRYI